MIALCDLPTETGAAVSLAAKVYLMPLRDPPHPSSFRDAPPGAGPESITPNGGYGFRARAKPRAPE